MPNGNTITSAQLDKLPLAIEEAKPLVTSQTIQDAARVVVSLFDLSTWDKVVTGGAASETAAIDQTNFVARVQQVIDAAIAMIAGARAPWEWAPHALWLSAASRLRACPTRRAVNTEPRGDARPTRCGQEAAPRPAARRVPTSWSSQRSVAHGCDSWPDPVSLRRHRGPRLGAAVPVPLAGRCPSAAAPSRRIRAKSRRAG